MTTTELKLYLIAFLATAYVVAWWSFDARAPDPAPAPPTVVEIPPGWHRVDRTAPVPVRAVQVRRIRTRSS